MKGIDYTDYTLGANHSATIVADGYEFVGRYLSNSGWKNLQKVEVESLQAHNIKIITVWETTETRPLEGYAAGLADGASAKKMADELGQPADKPIYFALDTDPNVLTGAQVIACAQYFKGIQQSLPVSRIGIYGGYKAVQVAMEHGYATYGWQTLAWSHGLWYPGAQVRQTDTDTQYVAGVSVDINESTSEDFGQW